MDTVRAEDLCQDIGSYPAGNGPLAVESEGHIVRYFWPVNEARQDLRKESMARFEAALQKFADKAGITLEQLEEEFVSLA